MSLFGRKKKHTPKDKLWDTIKDDKYIVPADQLIVALQSGDEGEIRAAANRKMRCVACKHEYRIGGALEENHEKKGYFSIRCPQCKKVFISFGPGSR